MRNPIIFYIFLLLVILNIADAITASYVLKGEANPLFLQFDNFTIVLVLKLLITVGLGIIVLRNKYNTNFSYYLVLLNVVLCTSVLMLALYNNVQAMLHPAILTGASLMTAQEKIAGYTAFIGVAYLLPLLLSVLTFKLYEWSVGKAVIKK